MHILEQVSDGYRYRTANGLAREQYGERMQPMIELHLSYSKGFGGGARRGIVAMLHHIEVGRTFTQTTLFLNGNGSTLMRPLARKNDRALREVAEAVDAVAEQVAEMFRAGDATAAFALLRQVSDRPTAALPITRSCVQCGGESVGAVCVSCKRARGW